MVLSIISAILILGGALIFVGAALGLLRLPDMFTRISAIGTAAGVGTAMIVLGVALQDATWITLLKAVVAILLQLITSVIGATAIARAAVLGRQYFAPGTDLETVEHLGAVATLPQEEVGRPSGRDS
ncbi:cation:proton antiporter [Ornithinimicrobium sp. Y1847]|uniref:cation:proton antiporter n=1 Tax=unclassified Ornithinimicrobium TaxID=2615080 RepID=UPI003B67D93F